MSVASSETSPPYWQTLRSGRLQPAPRRRRIPLGLPLLTVLGLLGLLLTVPAAPKVAAMQLAADSSPQVTVQIATITPLSPGPKDTLRITGRVVSKGGPDLAQVQISLHLGRAVASRTELHGLRAQPVPQQLAGDGQRTLGDGILKAGRSLPFTISIPISKLELFYAGVYPMQVTAIGQTEPGQAQVDLATTSTFLPYIPTAEDTTPATPLAWLIPLTGQPAILADGSLSADTSKAGSPVLSQVSAGGRLRGLLDALGSAEAATATVDPATIQALALAAAGKYRISGSSKSQPSSPQAKQWLADLKGDTGVSLLSVPYADPDSVALLSNGQRGLLDATVRRGSQILAAQLGKASSRLSSAVAVPPAGAIDTSTAAYYRSATHAKGLVLDASAVPVTGDNPSASATAPNVSSRLLLSDDVLTSLTTSGPGSSPRLAEQEVLAELAEAHVEDRFAGSPTQGGVEASRPLLIAPGASSKLSPAWLKQLLSDTGKISWLAQVPVTDLLNSSAEPRAALTYSATARAAQLPAATVDASAEITTATERLFPAKTPDGITTQPASPQSILTPIRDTAMSAVSSRWRDQSGQAELFLESASGALTSLRSQVRVVASPQVTLTSRSGKVPVTLENDLPAAVDVSLVLTSLDKSRVSSDTVVRRTVRAGQKVQVEVEVKAASAGTFPVKLALYSQDGLPLGDPAQVLVRSTKYGVVATIFTIAALSLLGLAVLIRAGRRILRRGHSGAAEAS
jgi:hypothetical protein